jgi:hypothetical protein
MMVHAKRTWNMSHNSSSHQETNGPRCCDDAAAAENRNEQGVDQIEENEDGEGGDKEEEDASIKGKHNGGYH